MRSKMIVAITSLMLAAPAFAQDATPRIGEACKAEVTQFCTGDAAKGAPMIRCLTQNETKLGASCATAVKETKARRDKVRTACAEDVKKLCADGDKKGAQPVQCLRTKTAELTKDCADAVAALPVAGGGGAKKK